MNLIDRLITEKFLKSLENISFGRLDLRLPDGRTYHFAGTDTGPSCDLIIHDWRVITNLAAKGDSGFACAYQQGWWETADLTNLITLGLMNETALKKYVFGSGLLQWAGHLSYFLRENSRRGSRRNVQAHYDLGNDFYKLWLDPSMTYSSALYKGANDSLEQAQHQKYDRIIERLGEKSGNLLEVGCGWGGFAERALNHGDFGIKGITLSDEQHAYANHRLQGQAQIALEDYRDQQGKFDHLVSIEMFEAVGEKYWGAYFNRIGSLLKQGGKAVIQTITIDDNRFDRYRRGSDMIRNYIFPGGMLPSPSRFRMAANDAHLRVNDEFHFGHDYARTLEQWLIRFDDQKASVTALGFDQKFIRMWRFYLAACIAGFRTNRISVMQVELQHA